MIMDGAYSAGERIGTQTGAGGGEMGETRIAERARKEETEVEGRIRKYM